MIATTRGPVATFALLALVGGAAGCGPRPPETSPPRLVLLYATCTLSRHRLGPYNPEVRYTPALSSFVREATVFLRHQTEAGQSGPAFASIFTGAQADHHGVYRHPTRLRDDLYVLAEAFADGGYETHFWGGHPMASADLNYGQGVHPENTHVGRWRHAGRWHQVDDESLTANDEAFAAILSRLEADPSYRAFVQVNFTLTHSPYTDVDPDALVEFRRDFPEEWPRLTREQVSRWGRRYRRRMRRLQWDFPRLTRERRRTPSDNEDLAAALDVYYKVNVHRLDRLFGQLVGSIRAAGLLDESLIAFTADHGETFFRPHTLFKWTHGLQLSPDVIQVPLIVRVPGEQGGEPYAGVSRSIDVYPTLLGLAGLEIAKGRGIAGVDLSDVLRGGRAPLPLRAFSHTMPLTPRLAQEFEGWLVSRLHPSTDVGLVWTAVRDGDTYVRRRRETDGRWVTEAFDLARDPGAARDTFDPTSSFHAELARELASYKRRLVERHSGHQAQRSLPEDEAEEALRALGYIE